MSKNTIEVIIQEALGSTVNYNMETMFPLRDQFGANGRIKKKLKLIKKLLPGMSSALLEGEQLLYVARGYVMNIWEQMFAGGTVAYYNNITCVVLTDRRILLVNSDKSGKQKHFRNQIMYTQIKKAKMKSFFSAASTLKLMDGSQISMGGFNSFDRKQMQELIPRIIAKMPENAPQMPKSLQYVCPNCTAMYTALRESCEQCGTRYKSAIRAAKMSFLLPGAGDIYLGHRFFGTMELIGTAVLWFLLVTAIISGRPSELNADDMPVPLLGVIVAITHVGDYFLTRAMGRKGLIAE